MTDNVQINTLAKKFVNEAIRPILLQGGNAHDVMVLLESVFVGAMIVNMKAFNLDHRHTVAYAEICLQNAISRLAAADLEPARPTP